MRVYILKQITKKARDELAITTVGQFDNPLYRQHKDGRLTASNFGEVIRRRSSTPCHSLVKKILCLSTISSNDVEYGIMFERFAISLFEKEYGKKVEASGLFIDLEYPFLGASPDGNFKLKYLWSS